MPEVLGAVIPFPVPLTAPPDPVARYGVPVAGPAQVPAYRFPDPVAGTVVRVAEVVRVRYRKYDGSAHRDYPARRLAGDDHGTWLGVDSGTPSVYHGQPSVERIPFVLLVPPRQWWTAMFNAPPRTSEVYCDVTSPARWDGDDTVDLIDLDLDVVRKRHTGHVELRDEDEFAVHRASFGYPEDLVASAYAAAAWLRTALGNGTEPFASTYRQFLAQVDGA